MSYAGPWLAADLVLLLGLRLHLVHLHHLVPIVVDHLDGNLAPLGRVEGMRCRLVQGAPRGLVDIAVRGALELLVVLLVRSVVG